MEHCYFHKGKKKTLGLKRLAKHGNIRVKKLALVRECYQHLENSVNTAVGKCYDDVLNEVAAFVKFKWNSSEAFDLIPTGVLHTGNIEGLCLEDRLHEKLKVHPYRISCSPPSLYSVVSYLLENKNPKYILLERFECLPDDFIDGLISLITDDNEISNVVLLVCMSMEASTVYTRCSLESYTRLAMRYFQFPAPKAVLSKILDAITFDADAKVFIDNRLFDTVQMGFLNASYSLSQLRKVLKLAVLRFLVENENFEGCRFEEEKSEESRSPISLYTSLLRFLYDLIEDPQRTDFDMYYLHSLIQDHADFFIDAKSDFQQWKMVWSAFGVSSVLEAVKNLTAILSEADVPFVNQLKELKTNLLNLDKREAEAREKFKKKRENESTTEQKVGGKWTWGDQKAAMERSKKERGLCGVFPADRQKFITLLVKVFSHYLVPYCQIVGTKNYFLKGSSLIENLSLPDYTKNIERAVSTIPVLEVNNAQLDLCIAYRLIQTLSKNQKKIPANEWLSIFGDQINDLPNVDQQARIFRCLGELEHLGIIRANSNTNNSAFQLLHISFTQAF